MQRKINIYYMLIMMVVLFFASAFGYIIAKSEKMKRIDLTGSKLHNAAEIEAENIFAQILYGAYGAIDLYRDKLLEDYDIDSVLISIRGKADIGRPIIKECNYDKDGVCYDDNKGVMQLKYPIEYGDQYFGDIVLSKRLDHGALFIKPYLFGFIFFAFILTAVMLFMLAIFIRKNITGPLSHVGEYLNRIRDRKEDCIPSVGNQEVDDLIKHINELIVSIRNYQQLEKRRANLAAIGQTAAQIAHDMRKPLSKMKSLLLLLPEKRQDENFIRNMVQSVEKSINGTNNMLSEILEFSKDKKELDRKEEDPQSIISAAIVDCLRDKNADGISLEYDLRHRNYLYVDGGKIKRVFTNIIDNAADAMAGNGRLWIKTADEVTGDSICTRIVIGNDGPAIHKDVLDKLFDPFLTHGKKDGTGLGLAICQKIIDVHGGSISVSSEPGCTEFTMVLPAKLGNLTASESELIHHSSELRLFREEEAAREEIGDAASTSEFMRIHKERGRPSRLLIVDDEPLFRETVRSLMDSIPQVRDHVRVVETDSAEKALKLFGESVFDYVIADIDMGRNMMDGYRMSGIILDEYPNTYILIHSNKRKEEMDKNIRGISSPRFMGFLPKPMKRSELLQFLACRTFEASGNILKEPLRRRKVLVVNDDEDLISMFKFLFKSPDVQVLEASNVRSAIEHFHEGKPDMILADINLGEGKPDGYELLRTIREKDKSVPFYIVSGYSKADEEPKAKRGGATGYIQLPLGRDQLDMLSGEFSLDV